MQRRTAAGEGVEEAILLVERSKLAILLLLLLLLILTTVRFRGSFYAVCADEFTGRRGSGTVERVFQISVDKSWWWNSVILSSRIGGNVIPFTSL